MLYSFFSINEDHLEISEARSSRPLKICDHCGGMSLPKQNEFCSKYNFQKLKNNSKISRNINIFHNEQSLGDDC